jgi:hypothetical protein
MDVTVGDEDQAGVAVFQRFQVMGLKGEPRPVFIAVVIGLRPGGRGIDNEKNDQKIPFHKQQLTCLFLKRLNEGDCFAIVTFATFMPAAAGVYPAMFPVISNFALPVTIFFITFQHRQRNLYRVFTSHFISEGSFPA